VIVRRIGWQIACLGVLLASPDVAAAATCTWTGLGSDSHWSTAANWDACGGAHPTPETGDTVVFPAGAPRANPLNDLVDLSLGGFQITGAPSGSNNYYVISGNALRLAGELRFSITGSALDLPRVGTPLVLDGATVISNLGTLPSAIQSIDLNGAPLTFAPETGTLHVIGTISGAGDITKQGANVLRLHGVNTFTGPLLIAAGTVALNQQTKAALGSPAGGTTVAAGATLRMETGSESTDPLTLDGGTLTATITASNPGVKWHGPVSVQANATVGALFGEVLELTGPISGSASLTIRGWVAVTGANPDFTGQTRVEGYAFNRLDVSGSLANSAIILASGGELTGSGTVGPVIGEGGKIRLHRFGPNLHTGDLTLNAGNTLENHVWTPPSGGSSGRLDVTGTVTLANSALDVVLDGVLRQSNEYTIIDNDGVDPVLGTFAGLPEGARLPSGDDEPAFLISYQGGTGNDVTLRALARAEYFLSEGSTGSFFDEDVLIANPSTVEAPITLTFLTPGGAPLVQERTLPAQSRTTIRVDQIPGLEATDVSTLVKSHTPGLSLAVERSMFWDHTYYAGHTGGATNEPANTWFFAEGSQGFFSTYVQITNQQAVPILVKLTFLRENATPVQRTYFMGALSRFTVDCGTVPELANSSFSIVVDGLSTMVSGLGAPVTAERAMYFGSTPARLFTGGHESPGAAPASSWFFAEGATGTFFDTFLLFGNINLTDATVTLQYLLDTGETVTRVKTVPAQGRLTVNIGQEDDPRLHHAAVSTLVTSDVPIVAERSMYWGGDGELPWSEAHNSFGVVELGLHWALAEGRIGGPLDFRTYILLANPQTEAADVTVTFLRESGVPIVKTYTVPPTSRFNIDVGTDVPEMSDESFGAEILVTNGMRIAVERSMYWDAGGVLFKGGTNATGVRLP
jgi:autotransporter-associated beta strand protein